MAAELPSPTSPKSPIEKPGLGLRLGHPITATAHSDAIAPTDQPVMAHDSQNAPHRVSAETVEESGGIDEELALRNAIERDLWKLTIEQAEIEWERERSEAVGDDEEGMNVESLKQEDNDDGIYDASAEDESQHMATNSGRYNQSNDRRWIHYPMRPDAENCAFYMKVGSCKFGPQCKFNHPPRRKNQGVEERVDHKAENSERAGQIECKFYLSSGGCKYGKDCKYSHGADKSYTSRATAEVNFLGLPIRPGEKECPYYMRTGSCKYGSNCRFHHPEPTSVVGADSSGYGNGGTLASQFGSSSSVSSWSSPRAFNRTSPFVPEMFSSARDVSSSNSNWKGYQAESHPPSSQTTLPIPPAFAMNNKLLTEIPLLHLQYQNGTVVEEYPERPGQPECTFFMKTGDCKFKSNCKFHHPRSRIPKPRANQCSLNDKGLPLRPDQPICTHYHRYGICKFGPACKYDHPSQLAILQTSFDRSQS